MRRSRARAMGHRYDRAEKPYGPGQRFKLLRYIYCHGNRRSFCGAPQRQSARVYDCADAFDAPAIETRLTSRLSVEEAD